MKKAQRPNQVGCVPWESTFRFTLATLLITFGIIAETAAQQTPVDTLPKPKIDTLAKPAARPDSINKPKITNDSLAKPIQRVDPLVKPRTQTDTTKKEVTPAANKNTEAISDSAAMSKIPGNVNKPVIADSTAATSDSTAAATPVIQQDSIPDPGVGARAIKGLVVDENGTGLPGVSIVVKNSKIQTVTTAEGTFDMKVPAGNVILVFTYVGFTTKEVPVKKQTTYNVQLNPEAKALKEVVVVGYGAQSKRDLASSTTRVTGSEYKSAVVNTVDQALQGRTTGVQVVETSGEPGAAAVVRIRGNNSLSGNNEPLYVIDGFPMPAYREAGANFSGAYTQNGLYGINPNDIESMEVLKDASATAIYGSRGANGVILITTKAGKRGTGRVELVNK
ncbi:MAG TPA: TonB-dependent receptor plug domain-containing protein, partial [Dyadobacter sp.]|nr:TonB-dependent receptor plug domain-containing protein [Dyadobacter sp.]